MGGFHCVGDVGAGLDDAGPSLADSHVIAVGLGCDQNGAGSVCAYAPR